MTPKEFLAKYGTRGWQLVVEEFIRRAPSFPGDIKLATEIGRTFGDLESVLRELERVNR